MKVYLDNNVIVYLRNAKSPELISKVTLIKDNGNDFVFSPAHLEEIAVSCKRHGASEVTIKNDIEFLTNLCGKNSFRPVSRNEVCYGTEYPIDCYNRVVDKYDHNDLAEVIEKCYIEYIHNYPLGSPKEMNNIEPQKILQNINYYGLLLKNLANKGFISEQQSYEHLSYVPEFRLKDKFCILEFSVNYAANWLEKLGYYREKKEKSRSRLHDVSHMIYGSYSDLFVTNDSKLLNKTKAVYSFLDIHTPVLSMDDFVNKY